MNNIILTEYYPYMPIIVGLAAFILILYFVCYRYTNPTNILMISFSAMVFLHLDLLSYNMTYPIYQRVLDFFVMQNLNTNVSLAIRIMGFVILTLPPFLVWFIPLVMMDEKLTGGICNRESVTRLKSILIFCFGLIMKGIFVLAIFLGQGL